MTVLRRTAYGALWCVMVAILGVEAICYLLNSGVCALMLKLK